MKDYPRRNIKKFGKCYFDYLKIEVMKGNLSKRDCYFWIDANKKIKADPNYTPFKFYASKLKPIPFNS